jgi:hypothetical protein
VQAVSNKADLPSSKLQRQCDILFRERKAESNALRTHYPDHEFDIIYRLKLWAAVNPSQGLD